MEISQVQHLKNSLQYLSKCTYLLSTTDYIVLEMLRSEAVYRLGRWATFSTMDSELNTDWVNNTTSGIRVICLLVWIKVTAHSRTVIGPETG